MKIATLLLAPALLALAGCIHLSDDFGAGGKNLPEPESWVESETFLCRDFEVLWETAKAKVSGRGYYIDDDATSRSRRRVVSTWKVEAAPMRNDGKRRRRFVEFVEVRDVKDGWKVRAATVRQRNSEMENPLDTTAADWREDEPDEDDAQQVAYLIEAQFKEYGPSKESEFR